MAGMISLITAIWEMKRNLRASRQALDRLRDDLLRRQILMAYEKVAFYRHMFDAAAISPYDIRSVADLKRLPIITRKDIRQNRQLVFNPEYSRAHCHRSHTSGSTGEPLWTYFDRRCWYRKKYFSKIRARMVCGLEWGQRVVILESEATRDLRLKNRNLTGHFLPLPMQYLSIFEAPEVLLSRLNEIRPHNVYGPPSCLFAIAKAAMQKGTVSTGLERIFTSSEYLTDPVRRCIEKTLGAKIYDVYGSTETKEVAWQCRMADGYHINEDEVLVEIVDDLGNVLPPGRPGHIVITDLHNKVMPLIRYLNRDKGLILQQSCRCGLEFALMKPLTGRASEHITLPDGRRITPFRFTTSIEKTEGLLQYQIIQERNDTIRVKTLFEKGCFAQGSAAIRSILSDVTDKTMTIKLEKCDHIDPERNGKLMVVKNEVDDGGCFFE